MRHEQLTKESLREVMLSNPELAKGVVDKFFEMMSAASELLRAADPGTRDTIPENATDVFPPLDRITIAHFMAIQSALTPEEAGFVHDIVMKLGAPELRAWFEELRKLSVPLAVKQLRVVITGKPEAAS